MSDQSESADQIEQGCAAAFQCVEASEVDGVQVIHRARLVSVALCSQPLHPSWTASEVDDNG